MIIMRSWLKYNYLKNFVEYFTYFKNNCQRFSKKYLIKAYFYSSDLLSIFLESIFDFFASWCIIKILIELKW